MYMAGTATLVAIILLWSLLGLVCGSVVHQLSDRQVFYEKRPEVTNIVSSRTLDLN